MIKRICSVFIIFILLFSLFSLAVCAENSTQGAADEILIDFYNSIPEGSGITEEDDIIEKIGFEALLSDIITAFSDGKGEALNFFLLIMGLAIMMAAASTVKDSSISSNGALSSAVEIGVCTIGAVSIFTYLFSLCQTVRDSLVSLCDFFSVLIPIMTAINSGSANVATASVQATNMNITLAIISNVCVRILMPVCFALFALAIVGSFSDGGVASVSKAMKSFFSWGIGILCAVSTAALAIQSVVASAKDSASLRAARYAASGLIPIVGSTVASALSTLAGGLAYAKSTVGATSIAVILTLALVPLASLLMYRLALSLVITFLNFADCSGGVRCFSAFRSALDSLTAIYSLSMIVCILEIVIFMKSGVSVF